MELDLQNNFIRLGIALLLGLIIGIQRGWVQREEEGGRRVAGVRTYTLIGLLGGVSALLAEHYDVAILVAIVLGLAALLTAAYLSSQRIRPDMSITGAVSSLLTFSFGVLAVAGYVTLAAAATVVTAVVLDFKPELHGLLQQIREQELDAGLKLLLISVVMLPILPNRGFGPWDAINPYEVWWMVVLIAGISFIGYCAVKIGGPRKGILFTGLFAGLTSSTALTIHYARISRDNESLCPLLASGVLAACGTMFPRVLLICSLINPALGSRLFWAVAVMTLLVYFPAAFIWWRHGRITVEQPEMSQNPLELSSAMIFGLILLVIILLSHALRAWLGNAGIYLLAGISGLSDVDAITLSLTRMSTQDLSPVIAARAIAVATVVNSLVKAGLAMGIGHWSLAVRVALPLVIAGTGGIAVVWLMM